MTPDEKDRIQQERERRKAKLAEGIDKVVDPIVQVKFQNLEDPPAPGRPSPPFEFIYETPKGVILSFKVSRMEGQQDTALRHGEIYELPLSVVNHLNDVKKPVYGQKYVKDPVTGGLRIINYIVTYQNRFACVPVNMSNYEVVDEGDKRRKAGRPPKKTEQEETNQELEKLAAGSGN